jgi:hypothetical protein
MAASGGGDERKGISQRPESHADLDDEGTGRREVAPDDARALI